MDKAVLDCRTGNVTVVPFTAAEQKQRAADVAAAESAAKLANAERAKRQAAADVIAAKVDPAVPDPTDSQLLAALAVVVS